MKYAQFINFLKKKQKQKTKTKRVKPKALEVFSFLAFMSCRKKGKRRECPEAVTRPSLKVTTACSRQHNPYPQHEKCE